MKRSGVALGQNRPLRPVLPKWRSDTPITDYQLRMKRDEFWETAPAYEGRKEIWDALRAAAEAIEVEDFGLAQAIVDGANITSPHGVLSECYDELGTRYVLPVYVLNKPVNLVNDDECSSPPAALPASEPSDGGAPRRPDAAVALKFRFSNSDHDVELLVDSADSVATLKSRLASARSIESASLRLFFSGKLLLDDQLVADCGLQRGYVVQVVVVTPVH